MANRRMFSLDVIDTDNFLEMPVTTQALYFHLGMRADDDGFVSSPKKIMKIIGCKEDDLKVLITKGYVIPFESGIVVIRHWKQQNYIQSDRYRKTKYSKEMERLTLISNVYKLDTEIVQDGLQTDTQYRLSKDIVRDSIDKVNNTILISPEPDKSAPDTSGIRLPLNDKTYYDVPLSDIERWKDTYPAVDVEGELKRMIAWLESNPTKKKTRRGINRFINSWLARTQDRGGSRTGQQAEAEPDTGHNDYYDIIKEYRGLPRTPDDPFQ